MKSSLTLSSLKIHSSTQRRLIKGQLLEWSDHNWGKRREQPGVFPNILVLQGKGVWKFSENQQLMAYEVLVQDWKAISRRKLKQKLKQILTPDHESKHTIPHVVTEIWKPSSHTYLWNSSPKYITLRKYSTAFQRLLYSLLNTEIGNPVKYSRWVSWLSKNEETERLKAKWFVQGHKSS